MVRREPKHFRYGIIVGTDIKEQRDTSAGDVLDDRLLDIFRLLEQAPVQDVQTILDIGAGQCHLAKHFASLGKKVTCTGVAIDSYVSDIPGLRVRYGIEYVECDIEHMPFAEGSFDAVVMCHVLEHCQDVSRSLRHARRMLREDGLLLIFVPPQEDVVCAGHVSTGWNVGQLMYVLLLNGFDIRNGNFIRYGYNICGFARRSEQSLPELRFDSGDITLLARGGFFPLPIGYDGFGDNFNGNIKSVNWPNVSKYMMSAQSTPLKRIFYKVIARVPQSIRMPLGNFLLKLGRLLTAFSVDNADRLV